MCTLPRLGAPSRRFGADRTLKDGADLRFCLRLHAGGANRVTKLRFRLRMHAPSGQKGAASPLNCPPRPPYAASSATFVHYLACQDGHGREALVLEQAEPQFRGAKTRFGVRAEAKVQNCGGGGTDTCSGTDTCLGKATCLAAQHERALRRCKGTHESGLRRASGGKSSIPRQGSARRNPPSLPYAKGRCLHQPNRTSCTPNRWTHFG